MSEENVEIIRRSNAAFNRGDVPATLEPYSREIEWRDLQHPPDSPELVRGIEAVERILSGWLDAFPDLRADVSEFIDAGDIVVCVINWRGSGKGSGTPVDEVTAETFEVRHGEIVRATFGYRSKEEALEAARLRE
ncbi:MAG: nuclear transport factor 2 family protein [Actinomycetota bacterium]|nr:nuclear transport factor 2 family protein [Actinomycetota bacterium]